MPDGLYGTKEVADQLKVSMPLVTHLARKLGVGRKVGGGWVFTEADIETMRNRPDDRKRDTRRGPKPKQEGRE